MKWTRLLCVAGSMIVLLSETAAVASEGTESPSGQNKESGSVRFNVYSDQDYGFKVQYQGTLVKRDSDEYVINLPSSTEQAYSGSRVHIYVAQQPFVDLPGTYGGRYYFDEGTSRMTASDREQGDSVNVNGLEFARDYWAVYAGMGQWETVINCYALHNGQYYVVSLEHDFFTPKPGEIVNGSPIPEEQIRARLIGALHDTTNSYVRSFNEILRSFSVTK